MKVSYNWLQEYFDKPLPKAEKLADILNTRAFGVEGILEFEDDYIIDIDVQPNRAHDCYCHSGIAKEISVLTGLPLKEIPAQGGEDNRTGGGDNVGDDFQSDFEIEIDHKKCFRYIGKEIKNVEVKESPDFIKKKLEALGQRSINNIVDLTNLVVFELGQPMHAFDKDKLDGNKIIVRNANKGEELTTLDDKHVVFDGNEMVIADQKEALVIAGIKGGKKAEVDESTKNIILESANFDPSLIRRTSKKIDIETDSSKRFEKGISPKLAEKAMNRITDLIKEYASGPDTQFGEKIDIYPRPIGVYKTGVSLEEINSKLGINLKEKEIKEVLNKLGFEFEKVKSKERFVETLKKAEGTPFKYGASVLNDAPNAFDCSSLTSYAAKESGQSIPRMVIDQFVWSKEINKKDLEKGDLIFSNQHIENGNNQKKFKEKPELLKKPELINFIASEHTNSKEFLSGTKVDKPMDHVGVYLGDGKIIHSTSTNDKGAVIEDLDSSAHFKDIVGYRRIFDKNEERYVVTIPDERLDLRIKEDIIEEIGRVYGYEKIKEKPIMGSDLSSGSVSNQEYNYLNKLRKQLTSLEFSEILTSTFVEKGDLETEKPVASDKAFLRNTLTENMKKALDLNEKNIDLLALERIKIFEIGHVFLKEGEKLMICIGVGGKKAESIIQDVLDEIGLKGQPKDGIVEIELKPEKTDWIDFEEIEEKKYKPFSQYPFVLRDIAVWVPNKVSEEDLLEMIKKDAGELLANSRLFDTYIPSPPTGGGRVSYAFKLVFQSDEKTLTDEEINQIMDKITENLNKKEGFEVR
jgi:phenylalanyl-tRNA synthetase beta subunit